MNIIKKSNIKWLVAALMLMTAIFLFIFRHLPYSTDDITRCVVDTEHHYCYVIKADGSPILYFGGLTAESLLATPSVKKQYVVERSSGCWINRFTMFPSCHGRIATLFSRTDSSLFDTSFMRNIINEEITNYDNTLAAFEHSDIEIDYYIDTHGENDEGFDDVIRYRDSMAVERKRIESVASALKKAYKTEHLSIVKDEKFYAIYKDVNNNKIHKQCIYVPTFNERGNFIIQTNDSITPDGVQPLNAWNIVPLRSSGLRDTVFVMGRTYITDSRETDSDINMIPEYIEGGMLKTYPRLNITKGSPIFTRSGIFIGILGGDTIIGRSMIRKSM